MGKPTPSRFVNKIRHLIENDGDITEVYSAFKQNKKIYTDKIWNRTKEGFENDLRRSPKKFSVYSELFKAGQHIIETDIETLVGEHAANVIKWGKLIKVYDDENERLKKEDKSLSSLGKYFTKKTPDEPDEKKTPKKKKKGGILRKLLRF